MDDILSKNAGEIAQYLRTRLVELRHEDSKEWNYANVAKFINSVTKRKMDASAARRFMLDTPGKSTVFTKSEAFELYRALQLKTEKLDAVFSGAPSVAVAFSKNASLTITFPVSEELADKAQKNPAITKLIEDTVSGILNFLEHKID